MCPPPRCRAVILPWLFRPPLRCFGRSRLFTGLAPGVNSAKSLTVAPRRPGVVGLYLRIPMIVSVLSSGVQLSFEAIAGSPMLRLEEVDPVFRVQRHDGLFPGLGGAAAEAACGAACPCGSGCSHGTTFTSNNCSTAWRMSSLPAMPAHLEGVGVVAARLVHPLLGHQRPEDDLVRLPSPRRFW